MKRLDFAWPNGLSGALTTSWDDGTEHDRRLIEIFNRNGIKGTFNLNSGRLSDSKHNTGCVRADEVKSLYAGHEVAVHSVTHPWMERQSDDMILTEIIEDRANLEKLVQYPVRGMAMPNGGSEEHLRVTRILKSAGIVYSRTTQRTSGWDRYVLPADFMNWNGTCHHKDNALALWDDFAKSRRNSDKLFYLWGHSYEFNNDDNWDLIEEFARVAGHTPNIWFATNMEVYDYVTAWRNLQCSTDISYIRNVSFVTMWFWFEGNLYSVEPGKVINL